MGSALGLRERVQLGGCLVSPQFGDCWVCKQLWGCLRPQRRGCRIGVSDPRVRFYVCTVCIIYIFLLYTGVWLARHGVCSSVIEWVTRRSDLLSSGAEGAEQLGGCLGTAQFWDCWVWEQRWACFCPQGLEALMLYGM